LERAPDQQQLKGLRRHANKRSSRFLARAGTDAPAGVLRLRVPGGLPAEEAQKASAAVAGTSPSFGSPDRAVSADAAFSVQLTERLSTEQLDRLRWLIARACDTLPCHVLVEDAESEHHNRSNSFQTMVEVGPRLSFTTAFSANATAICAACGLPAVTRLEASRVYVFPPDTGRADATIAAGSHLIDPMTEQVYNSPIMSFESESSVREPARTIDVLSKTVDPVSVLYNENEYLDLGMDSEDLHRYAKLFADTLRRNPTDVELFDIAQSNSEHCRHWFFRGSLSVDGEQVEGTLIDRLQRTLQHAGSDISTLAFSDNSSAIDNSTGRPTASLHSSFDSETDARLLEWKSCKLDALFTSETHNFPAGVAPFPGAETGTGGRIRDTHATGRGSGVGIATAGYSTGNLNLNDYNIPGEDRGSEPLASSLAYPKDVLIGSSDGASDYGNKFGEPVGAGFCRTAGLRPARFATNCGSNRREYLKPIMFSGGLGTILRENTSKCEGSPGFAVVKVGGPAYRIGMGGGAASSKAGGESDKRDLDAVQRGDAEMAQKLNRVVRALSELGSENPIYSIHDQGAGGNCNVVKEIVDPSGANVDVRNIVLGDATMSALEVWGAEYQENDCLLVPSDSVGLVQQICKQERCPMSVMGHLDGSGNVTVTDLWSRPHLNEPDPVVDLGLDDVLGKLPKKHFSLSSAPKDEQPPPLSLPVGQTPRQHLQNVLKQPSVCSKRFLTTKVDRSVTGLLTQQQCVGAKLLPIADYAAAASSYVDPHGAATSIGEQPLKGLAHSDAMARMSLGEALTNLAGAHVDGLGHVRCSCNWMWAPKLESEGDSLVRAVHSLCDSMEQLGVAVDGGKDSLSMAAAAGGETVRSPGTLVVSTYATSPDVSKGLTPDIKQLSDSSILLIDLARGKRRLGGSALAQSLSQSGSAEEMPDMDDPALLKRAFEFVQEMRSEVLSMHDVSDGGIVTALLEMAFAAPCGLDATLPRPAQANDGEVCEREMLESMFAEELGILVEVRNSEVENVMETLYARDIPSHEIARTRPSNKVTVRVGDQGMTAVDDETVTQLQMEWERTALRLEREQAARSTVDQEESALQQSHTGQLQSTLFTCKWSDRSMSAPSVLGRDRLKKPSIDAPLVGIVREEGSNGDREMHAAMQAAGLRSADIRMADIVDGRIELKHMNALAFVGGFSFGDVLGSATGWAASALHNKRASEQLHEFLLGRNDTLSLGVCNGCQLLSLLGTVPQLGGSALGEQVTFGRNDSARFESRLATLQVHESAESVTPWLAGMSGLSFGMWCAHGEGKVRSERMSELLEQQLAPLRYAHPQIQQPTEVYPFNPNGSESGVAGVCSSDGRHLAMMPHPERSYQLRQIPHLPQGYHEALQSDCNEPGIDGVGIPELSPWMRLFDNVYNWLVHSG